MASSSRLWLLGAVFGACFGLACNTTTEAQLESYGDDGAVEDYGCILGDLECECAAGDKCDDGLTCQDDVCKCLSADCALPPTTGNPGDGDGDPTETETAGDGDGDGDPTTGDGDGDGDPTTTGDGDGDPTTTGDGDGDPTTGDGDGDPTTGDGDGDPTTGDGDGDGDNTT